MSLSFPEKLEQHIRQRSLLVKQDRYLLAFSGGVDSVVLGTCLHTLGYTVEIAHVNFGLRGTESDQDEAFARHWAQQRGLPFHVLRASEEFWQKPGFSLQENARNLRYDWFRKVLKEQNLAAILTAHQSDDQVETLIQRYFRGAGPKGLSGIPETGEDCIRPLLAFSRKEIEAFAKQEHLSWAEDSSNAGNDYQRNQIRHVVKPMLEQIFPGFGQVLLRNAARMREIEALLESQELPFLEQGTDWQKLNRTEILDKNLQALLSRYLERLGFSWEMAQEVVQLPASGESRSWQMGHVLVERKGDGIWIWPSPDLRKDPEAWQDPTQALPDSWVDWCISIEPKGFIQGDPHWLALPVDGLVFPLQLRRPVQGDKFRPAGMKGRRDLSDVLSEAGLSMEERRRRPLLCDGKGEIIWIPGIRSGLKYGEAASRLFLRFQGGISV